MRNLFKSVWGARTDTVEKIGTILSRMRYQIQYVKMELNPFTVSTQTSYELHQTAVTTD